MNTLNPISVPHAYVGMGPSHEAWVTYQWEHSKKNILLPPEVVKYYTHTCIHTHTPMLEFWLAV